MLVSMAVMARSYKKKVVIKGETIDERTQLYAFK